MKIDLVFLKSFHKTNSGKATQFQERYNLRDLFQTIVEIYGINLATQIVVDSENLEWVFQFAGSYNERPELTTELREKLARVILTSEHENYAFCFFTCIRHVPKKMRKNLLDSSFVRDQLEKEKLLQQHAIGF